MSNAMKSPNEYQLYDMSKGNAEQKWQKKGSGPKGKESPYVREDKGEYIDHSQYQKHPNRKNFSSYSNKNQQGEDSDKQPGQKGNNQSPNYKKPNKFKKDNANDYTGNAQMEDNPNDKEDFQQYKKFNPQMGSARDGGGFNVKGAKGKYGLNPNGTYVPGMGPGQPGPGQGMNWDKSPIQMTNTQPHGQYPMGGGGYYDKKNNSANPYPNQNPNANAYQNQFNPQGQYNFRANYQNDPKPGLINLPQGKSNTMNSNSFNLSNQPVSYPPYCNTEPSNMSASVNQEQEPSNDSEDNYMQPLPNQFMYNKAYNMHEHMDNSSFVSGMSDSMMTNPMNSSNISMLTTAPLQPYPNMQNMNRGYQPEMYMQPPLMNQGNLYMNDPQMMKGMNRTMGMLNMAQGMPLGIEQPNPMFPMQQPQMPYGMNPGIGVGGVMPKTKKKSSKKIAQSPQEGMSNPKGGMKLHYHNTSGKYYNGSHSTQGVKNTMPNFTGANLSFMNMNANSTNNMPNAVMSGMNNQILSAPMGNPLLNSQGNPKGVYKQKKNGNNPYRNVTSDKTISSSIASTNPSKPRGNSYYSNKPQPNQYFNYQNHQPNRKYNKGEDYNAMGGDSEQSMSNKDLNEVNRDRLNNKVSFYVKVRLEENKEAVIEIKQNEDPVSVATALKQYKISDNQMTLIYNKIVETLHLMSYAMKAPLNAFDLKQISALKDTVLHSAKQAEPIRKRPRFFPLIQIEDLNETVSYQHSAYDNYLSEIKPDYIDIRHCELLNVSQ